MAYTTREWQGIKLSLFALKVPFRILRLNNNYCASKQPSAMPPALAPSMEKNEEILKTPREIRGEISNPKEIAEISRKSRRKSDIPQTSQEV